MQEFFSTFWTEHSEVIIIWLKRLAASAGVILLGVIIARFLRRSLKKSSEKINALDDTVLPMISTMISYGVYIVCFVIILDLFGVNTASIIALLGAAGVAIGLALKDTLANIASGLMLIILRPFKVGDYIDCKEVAGSIQEIRLFRTILKTGDGIFLSAPNSKIWGAPILNYSRISQRRMEISFNISHHASLDKTFDLLRSRIEEESRFLTDPAPQIFVKTLSSQSVEVILRAWSKSGEYWSCLTENTRILKETFDTEGISLHTETKVELIQKDQ